MKINCIDRTVREILTAGYYKVPRFQRPYSWEPTNVEDFWNDTIITGHDEYFIGSIVVFQTGDATYGIVDGQQRLTTVTMMLAALRNALAKVGEDSLARGIHQLIERPNMSNEQEYVLQTETSYPFFQEQIQKFGDASLSVDPGPEERTLERAFSSSATTWKRRSNGY